MILPWGLQKDGDLHKPVTHLSVREMQFVLTNSPVFQVCFLSENLKIKTVFSHFHPPEKLFNFCKYRSHQVLSQEDMENEWNLKALLLCGFSQIHLVNS